METNPMTPSNTPPELAEVLPEALAQEPALQGKSLESLAKEYVNAQKLIGRKGVPLPAREDDGEGWTQVHKALGCPDTAEGYAFELEEKPDWYSDMALGALKQMMHEAGLSQRQAARLHGAYLAYVSEQMGSLDKAATEREAALRNYLVAKPEAERQRFMRMAERGARLVELDEALVTELPEVFQDPKILEVLARMGEADLNPASTVESVVEEDPQALLLQLNKDANHVAAFLDRGHPGHAAAKAQRAKLLTRVMAG